MARTEEKVTFQTLNARAYKLGHEHGQAAARWYWDRTDPNIEDYMKVLKGIEDGDPAITDSLPHADLSGQWADGMTPQKLYEEVEVPEAFLSIEQIAGIGLLDDLCDAYESGFNIAAEAEVRQQCTEYLERDVRIEMECNASIVPEDLKFLINELEEVVNKHAAFGSIKIIDEDTEDDVTPS